jgi:ClpP class serine protease
VIANLSLTNSPWLVPSDWLRDFQRMAQSIDNFDFKALLAKRGSWLDGTRSVTVRGDVAIMPIVGPIFRHANFFSWFFGGTVLSELATDFRRALDHKDVARIVLDIDSPGGMVNGTSEFAEMIHRSKKPVTTYVGGMAASAAYWIASATNEIVVSDTALLGSIGVVSTCFVDDDESVVEIVSSQSPHKRLDVRKTADRERIQQQTDALAAIFIGKVARYRKLTDSFVQAGFGGGALLLGQNAVDVGMADRVSSLEAIIATPKSAGSRPLPSLGQLIQTNGYDGALARIREHEALKAADFAVA